MGRQQSVSSVQFKKYLKKKSSARKIFLNEEEAKDDSIVHSPIDDPESNEDEGNLSPTNHGQTSHAATLNVKLRLQQYNFITNRNDEKFSSASSNLALTPVANNEATATYA
jgi:hypothetical protein